jgi:hypothetical protein
VAPSVATSPSAPAPSTDATHTWDQYVNLEEWVTSLHWWIVKRDAAKALEWAEYLDDFEVGLKTPVPSGYKQDRPIAYERTYRKYSTVSMYSAFASFFLQCWF